MAPCLYEPEHGWHSGGRDRRAGRYAVTAAIDQTGPPRPWREREMPTLPEIEFVVQTKETDTRPAVAAVGNLIQEIASQPRSSSDPSATRAKRRRPARG
jgi:hypothetical protein